MLVTLLACAACSGPSSAPFADLEVTAASISGLQAGLEDGRTTSVDLVDLYFARIAAYDQAGPALNTIIRLNPLAREQAAALDAEWASGAVRGPLHGIRAAECRNLEDWADGPRLFEHLARLPGALSVDDVPEYLRRHGFGAGVLTYSAARGRCARLTAPLRARSFHAVRFPPPPSTTSVQRSW